MVIDGGACVVGIESTIVDATGAAPVLLRPGDIGAEELERAAGVALAAAGAHAPRAPGTLAAHYAPITPLALAEGDLALANVVVYLACAPKSNAAYKAFGEARADVEAFGSLEVPLRLRNAPTRLMKELDYGKGYRYAHDEPDAYARGERYLPDDMPDRHYYRPVARGLEIRIAEALQRLRAQEPKT